jgi:hypothetical protein
MVQIYGIATQSYRKFKYHSWPKVIYLFSPQLLSRHFLMFNQVKFLTK